MGDCDEDTPVRRKGKFRGTKNDKYCHDTKSVRMSATKDRRLYAGILDGKIGPILKTDGVVCIEPLVVESIKIEETESTMDTDRASNSSHCKLRDNAHHKVEPINVELNHEKSMPKDASSLCFRDTERGADMLHNNISETEYLFNQIDELINIIEEQYRSVERNCQYVEESRTVATSENEDKNSVEWTNEKYDSIEKDLLFKNGDSYTKNGFGLNDSSSKNGITFDNKLSINARNVIFNESRSPKHESAKETASNASLQENKEALKETEGITCTVDEHKEETWKQSDKIQPSEDEQEKEKCKKSLKKNKRYNNYNSANDNPEGNQNAVICENIGKEKEKLINEEEYIAIDVDQIDTNVFVVIEKASVEDLINAKMREQVSQNVASKPLLKTKKLYYESEGPSGSRPKKRKSTSAKRRNSRVNDNKVSRSPTEKGNSDVEEDSFEKFLSNQHTSLKEKKKKKWVYEDDSLSDFLVSENEEIVYEDNEEPKKKKKSKNKKSDTDDCEYPRNKCKSVIEDDEGTERRANTSSGDKDGGRRFQTGRNITCDHKHQNLGMIDLFRKGELKVQKWRQKEKEKRKHF